jgi:hypothetical protein
MKMAAEKGYQIGEWLKKANYKSLESVPKEKHLGLYDHSISLPAASADVPFGM